MVFQVLLGRESFSTLWAGERSFSRVLIHVSSQVRFLHKRFATYRALMWPLVGVQHHMLRKHSFGDETLSTLRADVSFRLFTRTNVHGCHVLCYMRLLREHLLANRTSVGLFTRMSQEVLLKLWRRDTNSLTSRLRAQVLASMLSPFMHCKFLQSREPHLAMIARERLDRHRFKLGNNRWFGFKRYLVICPVSFMNRSMLPHIRRNRKRFPAYWTHVGFHSVVNPSMHWKMGRLSESFSALFARIGFQAQVNVHVVLQLDPGAKLLLTPERGWGVSSSRLNGKFRNLWHWNLRWNDGRRRCWSRLALST